MKKLIVLGLVLVPCLAHAATDCKVVEFADHSELVCVGDKKDVPAPVPQPVTVPPTVSAPVPVQQTVTPPPDGAAVDSTPTPTMPTPAVEQTVAPPLPVVHRQGRPPKAVMDAARAMRNQVIQERLQQQQQQQ